MYSGLDTARNTAGNLQRRGQSYFALGSIEYIKFVAIISRASYNLRTTPLEEFVDNAMDSFTIVFVDRDIDKIGWQKMYRGKGKVVCSVHRLSILSLAHRDRKREYYPQGNLKNLESNS